MAGRFDKLLEAAGKMKASQQVDPVQAATMALLSGVSEKYNFDVTNKQLADGIGKAFSALDDMLGEMRDTLRQLERFEEVIKQLSGMSGMLKKLQAAADQIGKNTSDQSTRESVDRLRQALQSVRIPEPDLTPILKAIGGMSDNSALLSEIKALRQALHERPAEEWNFDIERETFSDKIQSVKAVRVA